MAYKESNEKTGAISVDRRCPLQMHNTVCGRPIYFPSSEFRDQKPVCLMHSDDPKKDDAAFQAEFDRILTKAGKGEADFSGFVFPSAVHCGDEFKATCWFEGSTFVGAALFDGAVFGQSPDFSRAKFATLAAFIGAKFREGACFWNVKFEEAQFSEAIFTGWVTFGETTFSKKADFSETTFIQGVTFTKAIFSDEARFGSATFVGCADFTGTTFTEGAIFYNTAFALLADFRVARFRGAAEFRQTLFRGDPRLKGRFDSSGIAENANSPKSALEDQMAAEPGPLFTRVIFEGPEKVIFYQTDLGRALFHNCDVSKVVFSDVEWLKRKGRGRSAVFDEIVDPNLGYGGAPEYTFFPARDLKPGTDSPDDRNYRLISEVYQRLEKNYDSSGDYTTAGDFHHGKMEMKRLETKIRNPKLRWLKRSMGLVAWYKYASEYGESYVRPAVWLLGTVFALGLLYPLLGLRYNGARGSAVPLVLKYGSSCPDQSTDRTCMGPVRLAANGLMASLQTATFQKDFTYEPAYPWGRLLALIELLLVSTLVGLFLLAVRRHFKR